jgi:hypothetical protein
MGGWARVPDGLLTGEAGCNDRGRAFENEIYD